MLLYVTFRDRTVYARSITDSHFESLTLAIVLQFVAGDRFRREVHFAEGRIEDASVLTPGRRKHENSFVD
jgi:hypothetical protein